MTNNKDNFFENNIFKFTSSSCDCAEDIIHRAPGVPPDMIYKFQSIDSQSIRFAYAAKNGLVRIASNGSIEENNVLGTLISALNKKPSNLKKFFKSNGFLFPINTNEYESFDYLEINHLINRIKNTVELMSAISEIKKDYDKILQSIIYLIFSPQFKIQTTLMEKPYISYKHNLLDLLENSSSFIISTDRNQEAFNKDTYTVVDSIFTPSFELDINFYNDIIGGYSTQNYIYKNITKLYLNYNGSDIERKTIDFIFHYFRLIGGFNFSDNKLEYSQILQSEKFTPIMKNTLLDIGKYILGNELNANLNGIRPIYDAETMTPSWNVDSLMSAIYFSLFYMKPDLELYRPCANPKCGNYFLVKTTTTQKKYCSTECCSRITQDKYRKRKRERQRQTL